jgi:hypothetical protein
MTHVWKVAAVWKVAVVAAVAAAASAVIALGGGAAASSSPGCAKGAWPESASGAPRRSISANGSTYAVWRGGTTWHLGLQANTSGVLAGAVSADGHLAVVHATAPARSALRRTAHAFSFRLAGTGAPQEIRFTASCAHRLSFRFSGGTIHLGSGSAPAPSFEVRRPPATGVEGRIIAGPTCPIVTPNCPPAKPAQAEVRIETAPATRSSGAGQLVQSVASDSNGAFSASLAAGDYIVTATPAASGFPLPRSVRVHVEAGVVTQATVALDTGIRGPAGPPARP